MKRMVSIGLLMVPVVILVTFAGYKKLYRPAMIAQTTSLSIEQAQLYAENALAMKADFFADEGVFKFNVPRTDVDVNVDGFKVDPFMGMSTWIAFQKGRKPGVEVMTMGDWVLFADEINHVISVALEHNIKITALHNHFAGDNPHVYFMHIEVEGTLKDVVAGIQAMLLAVKNAPAPVKKAMPLHHAITGHQIESIIPVKGTAKDGMFKLVMGRKIQASCGCTIGKNMGINSWIAFGGTDDNSIVDGDFALFEDEVQDVIKALSAAGINIVAIHNHMIHENPRLVFVHFWAHAQAVTIAQGLKDALDQTSTLTVSSEKN